MRIAMLSIHSSPLGALGTRDTGGMSVYLRHVSRQLGAAGHQVDIFTCAGAPAPPRDLAANVRLIRIGPGALAEMPKERLPDQVPAIFAALEAFRIENGLDYDLIHSHYWISGLVGEMAQSRWRRPHLVMFHTLGAAKNAPGSGEHESRRRVDEERRLAAGADRVVAPSAGEAAHLTGLYGVAPEKISLVPCGVDLELFQPRGRTAGRLRLGWPVDEETMLFVGRLAPLKGLENLIAALALLRPRHPRLTLRVVGGDDAQGPPALIRRAQTLGVAEAVRFMGRIEQTDLPVYYSAADLLALPSYYESFGLVVLEALACGTPVAATAVGVVPDVIREGRNGVVLTGPAPDAIAQGVAALLAVPGDPQRAAHIRRTVEKYGWPSVAADIETLYRQILSGRN
ncbi:MAG: glycosyltransferase [Desulfobacterales bacterium]|nr:glycosyltransferase [Desulfobacterales bacterium]